MIVVERGLNILSAQIAERPAQPGFRRRTDGPYTWISFLKAFILSNPRAAATFTVLRATAQRNSSASLCQAVSFQGFDGAPPGYYGVQCCKGNRVGAVQDAARADPQSH